MQGGSAPFQPFLALEQVDRPLRAQRNRTLCLSLIRLQLPAGKCRSWQSFNASSAVHPEEWNERASVRQDALNTLSCEHFELFSSNTFSPRLPRPHGSVASAERCKVCLLFQAADSVALPAFDQTKQSQFDLKQTAL